MDSATIGAVRRESACSRPRVIEEGLDVPFV